MTAPDPLAGYRMPDGRLLAFTSFGSYPIVYLDRDCDAFCAGCANEREAERGIYETATEKPIVSAAVHWEGEPIWCEECGAEIESAYGPVAS